MSFFRIFQHLLPRSKAWSLTADKFLRRFFAGLSEEPTRAREFVDLVFNDQWPESTRELDEYERQHGIVYPASDEATRRLALAAEFQATGGQSSTSPSGSRNALNFAVLARYVDFCEAADLVSRSDRRTGSPLP